MLIPTSDVTLVTEVCATAVLAEKNDYELGWWTGFYTSVPELKTAIRQTMANLRSSELLSGWVQLFKQQRSCTCVRLSLGSCGRLLTRCAYSSPVGRFGGRA